MAEAIVSTTVEMLGDLLIQQANFLSGVRKQVQDIQAELQRMQCFLKDADRRPYEDERVRNWVRSIRNLAYKTENVLETYAIKVESRKGKGIKKALKRFACLLDEGVNLHKLGLEIENIKTEISNLTTSLQTYGIKLENEGESSNATKRNLLRQTFAQEIEEDFVGMQNDVKRLVSLLIDTDKTHRIISIYGMGGAGKTTLAKKVFKHKDVQNQFESFAWVSVSQQFIANSLLQGILRQLDPRINKEDVKKMEYEELVQELCRAQGEKKCLVVLDDIWKREHWTILSHAFPITAFNWKVLLTTRIQEVAEIGISYKLNLFSEEEGWQLLKKKALTSANARDSYVQAEQEKSGREMVRQCGYLPLAISVIGGILSKKETVGEWQMVKKNIYSYLRYGDGVEDNYRVMQILALSYEDLPYQLKPCLLYLAYYPEDTEMDVRNLYWMWIAEGMVLSKDQGSNETLMEVAERYLTVLASRSLVQVQLDESSVSSSYKSCRLHDLIRDLCLRKCKEEDFLEVMNFQDRSQSISDLNSPDGNAHRLVIYGKLDDTVGDKILQETNKSTRLYSLRYLEYPPIAHGVSKNLRNFPFLKIVTFGGLEFSNTKVLGRVIKRLIHIRFLSFENCRLDEVPSSVAKLPYLQTFHFHGGGKVKIPNVFWKLKRLIHLVLEGGSYGREIKLRLDCLSGLETLICDDPEVKDLSKLTNLRVFSSDVKDNESFSLIINCIEVYWCNIREISLCIYSRCDFISTTNGPTLLHKLFVCRAVQRLHIDEVRIRELPKYELGMLASSDLVELQLNNSRIEEDPMPTLEKLPKLRRLWLISESFIGKELICSSNGFPNLTEILLRGLPNLENWRIDEGAMPNLSIVSIWGCLYLEMIPDGMKFLKALRKLVTDGMPIEFNNRIRDEEGADFHKVSHVPFISIQHESA